MVVSRRDVPGKQGKVFGISMESSTLVAYVKGKLDEVQSSLLESAKSFRDRYVLIKLVDDIKLCVCTLDCALLSSFYIVLIFYFVGHKIEWHLPISIWEWQLGT